MALLRECLRAVRTLHGEDMPLPMQNADQISISNTREIMQVRTPLPGTSAPNDVSGRMALEFLQRTVPESASQRRSEFS